jgi:Rnl2 family RNA ligase
MDDTTFPPFAKYSSFENSYRENVLRYIATVLPDTTLEWVALEKIHGCNFSATTDGTTTKWASRTSYLGDSALSKFNRADVCTARYKDNVATLYAELKAIYPEINYITVFGELFGGIYPGLQLPHKYKAIQKEVRYTTDIEFMVFDIKLGFPTSPPAADAEAETETETVGEGGEPYQHFLDPLDVIAHCRRVGLRTMDIMHRGPLQDMLKLDAVFQTTIPDMLGLPPLPDNAAEGYVLKPLHSVFTPRGRIMLKHKNPKFSETVCEKPVKVVAATGMTPENEATFVLMQQYININRFNAVMSKVTDDRKANSKAVIGMTVKDAMDDVLKDPIMAEQITPATKGLFFKKLLEYTTLFWDENPSLHLS